MVLVRGRTFGVLGPLRVTVDGCEVPVSAPRQRVVLAALLVAQGRPVSPERLVDTIWGEAPPATARVTLQNYVKRLRAALGADCIETTAEGYRVVVARDQLDLVQFSSWVQQARAAMRAGSTRQAADLYRTALTLWRGRPLPDLQQSGWLELEVSALVESHLQVVEEWAGVELVSGAAADVAGPLSELVKRWPLRESLSALLIRALHGCGRTADALAEYTRARDALVGELGIDPGEHLRAAHRHVLDSTTGDPEPRRAPAHLPAVSPWLVGRDDAVARLDQLTVMDPAGAGVAGSAGIIAAISGTAGVGKTTLAVHWARRAADRFPGGQLYVNLRGYDPTGPPVDPAEVLVDFLGALGVAGNAVPMDVAARAATYRSAVAGRRMLIVLDNARDVEQVRPLLPGVGGSVVVVTSRDRLMSLVAAEGAVPIHLDLLTPAESVHLLRQRLGRVRADADPDAMRALAGHCARLPLALSLAAARAAHSRLSVAELAAQLSDPRRGPLEVLRSGDRGTDLRDVLSWSTDHLGPEPARAFRFLGLHPGPDFTPETTARLLDRDRRRAHALLDDLARAQLLIEHAPDRYTFHDLLRAHAVELSSRHDSDAEQRAAGARYLEHLADAAVDAHAAIAPSSSFTAERSAGRSGADDDPMPMDSCAARGWMQREEKVVAAAVRHFATRRGLEHLVWPLAWCTGFERIGRGELAENLALHRLALAAAIRSDDRVGQLWIRLGLGTTQTYLGSLAEAEHELGRAHDLARDGAVLLHVATHQRLATYHDRCGDFAGALRHGQVALDLYADHGDKAGAAHAQNSVGWALSRTGQHERALPYCVRALSTHRRRGDREGTACTLDSLGHIYLHLGRHREAIGSYVEAVEVLTDAGRHLQLAEVVEHLGDAYSATGDLAAAHSSWVSSLNLLERLRHPNAVLVRAKVAERGGVGAPSSTADRRPRTGATDQEGPIGSRG